MTDLEIAIENRDRLWKLYRIAERERIARILRLYHYNRPYPYGDGDKMRKVTYELADQILRRG